MGDIIGSVISILTDNPIFALALIFIVLSNLLKSSKSSDDTSYEPYNEQYDNPYDDSYDRDNPHEEDSYQQGTQPSHAKGSMTWEDMERAYGIKIARKEEPQPTEEPMQTPIETMTQTALEKMPQTQIEEVPPIVITAKTGPSTRTKLEPIKKKKKRSLSLEERLAQYNIESTAALQELATQGEQPVLEYGTENLDAKETGNKRNRTKLAFSVKEGMKWAIILDKPRALRAKYR